MTPHSTDDNAQGTWRWYLSILGNVILWVIIGLDVWILWPTSLGGSATLIVISGNSMAPVLSDGDFVFARTGEVAVGDVVVYEPADMGGARIVHRIVGGDGVNGWIVQGDSNSWVDQWRPTDSEIVGRMELHIDGAGRFAWLLLSPWLWGFILLGAVILIVWPEHDDALGYERHHYHQSPTVEAPREASRETTRSKRGAG